MSNLWFVFPTAQPTRDPDPVAGAEWWIAPETWHQQGQQSQTDPTFRAAGLGRAGAGMGRGFALRVLHAVVQHTPGAQHPRYVLDRRLEAVGRVIARTLVVPLVIVELLTVSAAQPCLDERRVLHRRRCVERVPLLQAGRRVPPAEDAAAAAAGMDDRCHGFVDDRIVVLVHLQVIKVVLQLDVARISYLNVRVVVSWSDLIITRLQQR